MKSFIADKYIDAQNAPHNSFEQALGEIKNGKKTGHWIWYVFPQLKGLGHSSMSDYYGLSNLDEAKQYLNNPLLKQRLIEIAEALMLQKGSIESIVGRIDVMKIHSSMTLFHEADPNVAVFKDVLDRFYEGKPDSQTLKMIKG